MQRYEHSGIVPVGGLLLFSVVAVVAAILGAVYAFLVAYIPFIYVNFAVTVGFAYVLGTASSWCARVGKIRNTFAVCFLAFAVAMVGYYVSWAFDPLARFGPEDGGLVLGLGALFTYIQLFYEQGTWTLFGDTEVTGLFLGAIWFAEAVIIFGGATALAAQAIVDHPFCERCGEWTTKEEDVRRLSLIDVEPALLERLKEGELEALDQLAPAADGENPYLRLDLASCLTCSGSNFATLQVVSTTVGDDGKVTATAEPMLENLIVDADQSMRLRVVGTQRTADGLADMPRVTGEGVADMPRVTDEGVADMPRVTDEGDELYPEEAMPVG